MNEQTQNKPFYKKPAGFILLAAMTFGMASYYTTEKSEPSIKPFNNVEAPRDLKYLPGEGTEEYKRTMERWNEKLREDVSPGETLLAPPPAWSEADTVEKKQPDEAIIAAQDNTTPNEPTAINTADVDGKIVMASASGALAPLFDSVEPDFEPTQAANPAPAETEPKKNKNSRQSHVPSQAQQDRQPGEEELKMKVAALTALQSELKARHYNTPGHVSVETTLRGASTGSAKTGAQTQKVESISPGEMFLCKFDMSVDSRVPKSVIATCLNGPVKNARIVGTFEQREDMLMFQFNTLTLNRTTIPIQAFAVDPDNYSAGLGSEVDHHYVLRTAGLFASAFLEGLGQTVLSAGTVTSTQGVTVIERRYDAKERLAAGVGKIGERTAPKAEALWNKPATVKEHKDKVFGLVFTQAVLASDLPKSAMASK
ncbi:MAG: DotG/IcmE/VirB10 family protein [Gammaproteobacteria bacterium]|nr:DotG/IcmE/VirB10 family protein [Gammaproteobacteria bacterium]